MDRIRGAASAPRAGQRARIDDDRLGVFPVACWTLIGWSGCGHRMTGHFGQPVGNSAPGGGNMERGSDSDGGWLHLAVGVIDEGEHHERI